MSPDSNVTPKVLRLYLEITQYPLLAPRIRQKMREELFGRGVILEEDFEHEVQQKALESQRREGIVNPLVQETADQWGRRLDLMRDNLTDFYFAYNLPHDLFREIVVGAMAQQAPEMTVELTFNPELAPFEMLFAQAEAYMTYPPEQQARIEHHQREILVVIIKAMISDHLGFVRLARKYFTIYDLRDIYNRRIGRGKIGGKAAGMLLAHRILRQSAGEHGLDIDATLTLPESWYLGSDVFYDFKANNQLFEYMNQKYKSHEQMREGFPRAQAAYEAGRFPLHIEERLRRLLEDLGKVPLIVRSSSLLEDSLDTSFVGKYDSFFLPNQGTVEENLADLTRAVARIYASVIRPEVLIYREHLGLTDYDERMAILFQKVEGEQHGRYFFPSFAGVGYSHNPYRWSRRIRHDEGFVRLVAGLGTRAVERVGDDYPRMVALSHPELRPERSLAEIRRYSQHYMDVLDLEANSFTTVPIEEVLVPGYPGIGAVMSVEKNGVVEPMARRLLKGNAEHLVVTFDNLLQRGELASVLRNMLATLQQAYQRPIDIEFAGIVLADFPMPRFRLSLLQCRTLRQRASEVAKIALSEPSPEDILFRACDQAADGLVTGIRYIIYVDPDVYAAIDKPATRLEIGRIVGRLNAALADERFIMMGPGRWGSSNIQLGVRVTYADIYNTRVLVEIAVEGGEPEVSYGTHFFQDLVEANIYPLPLYPNHSHCLLRTDLLRDSDNLLASILPDEAQYASSIRVIDVPANDPKAAVGKRRTLTIIMRSEHEDAVAFFDDAR